MNISEFGFSGTSRVENMIGPLQLRHSRTLENRPAPKLEAVCHHCGWADFQYDEQDLRERLIRHLNDEHIAPPPPIVLTKDQMPGR